MQRKAEAFKQYASGDSSVHGFAAPSWSRASLAPSEALVRGVALRWPKAQQKCCGEQPNRYPAHVRDVASDTVSENDDRHDDQRKLDAGQMGELNATCSTAVRLYCCVRKRWPGPGARAGVSPYRSRRPAATSSCRRNRLLFPWCWLSRPPWFS